MSKQVYASFRLGDIFEKLSVTKAKKKELKKVPDSEYCIPVVYAKFGDNGIMYWGKKDSFTTYSNVISIVYNGVISAGRVYAQERATGVLAESYFIRLKDKADIPFEANFYIATVIEHVIYPKYSRENLATWDNKVENEIISLPVKDVLNKELDYEFMQNYIHKFETNSVQVMKKAIEDEGVGNCVLNKEELKAYNDFCSGKINTKKFKLRRLFDASTGDVDLQQKDINGKGCFFINSGVENNGVKGKTDRNAKVFPSNTITIDFWGNAYYRDFPYKLATHNHVFSLSGEVIKNKLVGLYIVGQLSKLSLMFSYDNMATWNKLKEISIELPVINKNNTQVIDYEYMENLIRAIEKKVIMPAYSKVSKM